MTEQYDERAARRRYVHRKQVIVLSIVSIALAVALVLSLLFMNHTFGLGLHEKTRTQPNHGVAAPCLPVNQDGNASQYPEHGTVTLRVLNATNFSGLAKAVGQEFSNRGFNVKPPSNYTQEIKTSTIFFGRNAIIEAYTVAANFPDVILRMDNREDKLIDVVVGSSFKDLKQSSQVPAPNSPIENIQGCVSVEQLGELPAAPEHEAA